MAVEALRLSLALKKKFADATRVPTGEASESSSPEFADVFNNVFGFHDAEVLSSRLDLVRGELDLLLGRQD